MEVKYIMFNQKVLASVMAIGIIGSFTVVSGTAALMSDTETGIADIAAGTIDLELGLSNGNGPGNDEFVNGGTATLFDIDDAKPLDRYESTVAFRVTDNPSYICSTIQPVRNAERGLTEPEQDAGDTTQGQFQGELGDHLTYSVWVDDGDNIYEDGVGDNGEGSDDVNERYIIENDMVPTTEGGVLELPLMDSNYNAFDTTANGDALAPGETKYLGVEVHFADGPNVNQAQSDRYTADVNVTTVQSRNNDQYICPGGPVSETAFQDSGETTGELFGSEFAEDGADRVHLQSVDSNDGLVLRMYSDNAYNNEVGSITLADTETDYVDVPSGFNGQVVEAVRLEGAASAHDVGFDRDGDNTDNTVFQNLQ